jgi:hypothetical protein
MLRNVLGFAVLAILVWLALKLALGILGTLFGLAITVLVLAAMGYVLFLILRLVSPATANRVRETISGHRRAA